MQDSGSSGGSVTAAAPTRRPERTYRTGPATRGLRRATWALVVVGVGTLLVRYPTLPETIPVHFDVTGTADGFGDRTSVLWLAVLWVLLQGLVSWLSARPHAANYPVEVTEDNAQRLYREGERLLVWVSLAMAVAFAGIVGLVVTGAQGWSLLLGAGTAGMLVACAVGVGRMLR